MSVRRSDEAPSLPCSGRQIVTRVEPESPGDVTRHERDGIRSVGRQEDVSRQVEQPGQLVTPCRRLLGAATCLSREMARDDADCEQRKQRDPILRIGDRPGSDRRQKKVVEAQERHQRCRDRDPAVETVATTNTTSRNESATIVGFVTPSHTEYSAVSSPIAPRLESSAPNSATGGRRRRRCGSANAQRPGRPILPLRTPRISSRWDDVRARCTSTPQR